MTTPEAPGAAAPAPAPIVEPTAAEPVDGLTRAQVLAIYGLVVAGAVAIVVLRTTRRRAGELGAPVAGAPSAAGAPLALELDHLPADVRAVLRQYADATEQRLTTCASALDALAGEVGTLSQRVTDLAAGVPLVGRTEPLVAPSPASVSVRDSDDLTPADADELAAAVPPVPADAVAGD